jgi:hypothetical protein
MYDLSSDWVLKFSTSRTAKPDPKNRLGFAPIPPIEPDAAFTKRTIGIYATSVSANPNWYPIGYLMQGYLVGFGTTGYAEGETIKIILNRYKIHQFNEIPHINGETIYRLSFSPLYYYKDVNIKVWEYIGTNQGVSNEDLKKAVRANTQLLNNVLVRQTQAREILNKIKQKTGA